MELLGQGITLMVIGMATVIVFLVLLIAVVNASAGFFRKFAHLFPEEVAATKTSAKTGVDPAEEIAAIIAAIRAKRG